MRALAFLTARTFVNGVKRAVTNPRRLIALLFALFWFARFVLFPTGGEQRAFDVTNLKKATDMLQSVDLIRISDALVFTMFAFMTFFLALGSLSTRNTFRPADVDVLFPTPVEPRLVLVFRIFRDYLLTLLAPLFFIIVGFRPATVGVKTLQNASQNPEVIGQTLRVATGAWLLVALCWVCINYAASLFVNRSDLASTRNRKILGWSLGFLVIAVCAYIAWQASQFQGWQDWANLTQSPFLRVAFFTATLSSWTVHGMIAGEPWVLLAGLGGLVAIIALCFKVAVSQAGWMYDQAAVKGFDSANARQLQQQGDTIGLITAQARQGKIKAGRTAWVSRINAIGPKALLWKEVLIIVRSTWSLVLLFILITLFMTLFPLIIGPKDKAESMGYVFMALQGLGVFMSASALSQAGFIEMLRRVDVQKPLPFTFSTTVIFEVFAKALPGTITAWISSIVALIIYPAIWQEALASILAAPFLAVLICLITCLMAILFPDFEDPTQRGFRGMMNLFGVVVLCAPGALAFIGLTVAGYPFLAACASAVINAGVAAIIASIAGNQYGQFNPSE